MIKDRLVVLIFRSAAVVFSLVGILNGMGLFAGEPGFSSLLYYTNQSNILVFGLFTYLLIRTILDLKVNGRKGHSSYVPRLHMYFTLAITITLLVFWIMLAPAMGAEYLLTFGNFAVHLITPLLAIADYILFTERGHLKKRDIFMCMIIPAVYLVQATILGFSGIVYDIRKGVSYYFPYFFMDYYTTGALVAAYIPALLAIFMLFALGIYALDRKLKKPKLTDNEQIETSQSYNFK